MPNEVLRDTKYKTTAAGLPFTESEATDWRSRVANFLNSAPNSVAAGNAKATANRALAAPRQTSLDLLMALENQLRGQFGVGLAKFDVVQYLDSPVVDGFVGFPEAAPFRQRGLPPTLIIASDQSSCQCCPFAFLRWKARLNFFNAPTLRTYRTTRVSAGQPAQAFMGCCAFR